MNGRYRLEYKFKLEEFDDGKQKWQSYECEINDDDSDVPTQFSITGYGANAQEAKEDMLIDLDNFIKVLLKFRESLKND